MRQRIRNLIGNDLLIKVASLNSVSVAIRILGGLLTSKFIAIFIGPAGLAVIGNLRDLFGAVQSISTLGLYNGIIKYVAELKEESLKLSKLISTVVLLQLGMLAIISVLIFFSASFINDYLFFGSDYTFIIKLLSIALPFFAAKTLIFALLNGLSKFTYLLNIHIAAQIVAVAINCFLIWKMGLKGALMFIVLIEVVLFFISLIGILVIKVPFPPITVFNFDFSVVRNMSSYAIMALLSAILLPIASVFIRNYLSETISEEDAGFWVAMTRISNYYLMFASSLIALYVLPKLSAAKSDIEFRKVVLHFYKSILPIFISCLILIYLCRFFIIDMIFSEEFEPVTALFKWQLIGDLLKVLSMVIAYQFLAKKMVLHYIVTELISISVFVGSSVYLINLFGTEGATMGHLVSYVVYSCMIVTIFYKSLFSKERI